jgi:hypothetical protein
MAVRPSTSMEVSASRRRGVRALKRNMTSKKADRPKQLLVRRLEVDASPRFNRAGLLHDSKL